MSHSRNFPDKLSHSLITKLKNNKTGGHQTLSKANPNSTFFITPWDVRMDVQGMLMVMCSPHVFTVHNKPDLALRSISSSNELYI